MVSKLTGKVHTWNLFDRTRQFGEVTLPYQHARQYAEAVRYNALNGKGQQREIHESHLRKLKSAMTDGSYTPTPASANLSKAHREQLVINGDVFELEVSPDNPLLLTDAGHRFEALNRIINELDEELASAEGKEREKIERWREQVLNTPVTITIYFDGDAQKDFVNLQLGRPVDAAHMLSLKVQQKILDDPSWKLAFDTAKQLNKVDGSPFKGLVRFDSRGEAPLPISTLCSKGSSDLSTSLLGLAHVGLENGKKDASWLASMIVAAHEAIKRRDEEKAEEPAVLDYGKVLTTIANSGKKGQATMMIGVGICLAYRLMVLKRENPTEEDLSNLVEAVESTLNENISGNFSGPTKRKLMGRFAKSFFSDLNVEKHHGIPTDLIKALSASTFGVEAMPKPVKKTRKNSLPDVDSPIVVTKEHAESEEVQA